MAENVQVCRGRAGGGGAGGGGAHRLVHKKR